MSASWGRRALMIPVVGAMLLATGCPPDTGGGETPHTQQWSGSFTSTGTDFDTVAGPVCLTDTTSVTVAIAGNTTPVTIVPPGGDQFTTRHVYNGGGSASFELGAGCHSFTVSFPYLMIDPAQIGGSFTWTISTPATDLPISSPYSGRLGRQGSVYFASDATDLICLPVGSGIRVSSPDPSALGMVVSPVKSAGQSALDLLPLRGGGAITLVTTEPCQRISLSLSSFAGLDEVVYPYTVTWPVPAPPTSAATTITTTGAEPVGAVLWQSEVFCAVGGGHSAVQLTGNSATVAAVALLDNPSAPFGVNAFRTSIIPAGGGARTIRPEYPCYSVQLLQQPDGVGVAQHFDVALNWPVPPLGVPHTVELNAAGGATDVSCAGEPQPAQIVTVAGATGPWTVSRLYSGGVDGAIEVPAGGTAAQFGPSSYGSCARFIIEHTPVDPASNERLRVTVSL